MSKWTSLKADYGWRLTPDGFLEQWGALIMETAMEILSSHSRTVVRSF
ncbi:TPA: hypothetical protein ORR38_001836 [Escherichia coli]|nr:hypothetical protein [Escherichia coli]